MITKQLLHELFEYKDGDLYWKVDRGSNKLKGKKVGSKHNQGYCQMTLFGGKYLLHRLIFMMFYGYLPQEIDHIDMDRANNKIENLRAATSCENKQNIPKRKNNTTGVKNVFWNKRTKKWTVQIRINKKQHHFGYFKNFELAELVAIEARNKYHKQFARNTL